MNLNPAYLFIGSPSVITQKVYSFLQTIFCAHNSCNSCSNCTQIEEKTHHGSLWISPEKRYSVDDLESIFKKTKLQLNTDEHYFFVLDKADFLNPACANRLLKLVEEPPPGYHFIFLAQRAHFVLPTIKSRCLITHYNNQSEQNNTPKIVQFFIKSENEPVQFLKEVSTCTMTEQECMIWIDFLLDYWIQIYKQSLTTKNSNHQTLSLKMITVLKEQLQNPPGVGSAKLFWKNLYLQK